MTENTTPIEPRSTQKVPFHKKIPVPIGFVDFLKKFGIVGIAIGLVTGAAVTKLVASLNDNIINPLLSLILGKANLGQLTIGPVKIGAFVSSFIDFMIIMLIVYIVISVFISRFMDTETLKK